MDQINELRKDRSELEEPFCDPEELMELDARQLQELSDAIQELRAEEIELIQQRLLSLQQLGVTAIAIALVCASLFPFTP